MTIEPAKKILIVEENIHTLYAFRLLLENEGFTIMECQSVKKAVEIMADEDFYAAFVDLSMDQPLQPLLLKHMKNIAKNTPVIIISSHPNQEHYRLFENGIVVDLLEKPLSIYKLRQILKRIAN